MHWQTAQHIPSSFWVAPMAVARQVLRDQGKQATWSAAPADNDPKAQRVGRSWQWLSDYRLPAWYCGLPECRAQFEADGPYPPREAYFQTTGSLEICTQLRAATPRFSTIRQSSLDVEWGDATFAVPLNATETGVPGEAALADGQAC